MGFSSVSQDRLRTRVAEGLFHFFTRCCICLEDICCCFECVLGVFREFGEHRWILGKALGG